MVLMKFLVLDFRGLMDQHYLQILEKIKLVLLLILRFAVVFYVLSRYLPNLIFFMIQISGVKIC